MSLPELLSKIDELQARIVAAGPLSPEAKRKLDYRFRLDWNYHSNVMEGSSLTKLETRTIMLGNVTVDGKPIKDVLEMKGHDDIITKLLQMSSGELQLSEGRIKEVHKAIVKEDDPEKKDWVGQWKPVPNYLTNYRGERIDFTPPEQVAESMHRLLDRTKSAIERIERKAPDAPHPALLAFAFHREYVTIHPFHDGNGRTARIFSNLLLMRFGLPPVIIKVEEKEAYNRLLAEVQVYGASPDLFNEFMSDKLLRAQELVVRAIEGDDLSDDGDIDKEIELLKRRLSNRTGPQEERNLDVITQVFKNNLEPLFAEFVLGMSTFCELFLKVSYSFRMGRLWDHQGNEFQAGQSLDAALSHLMGLVQVEQSTTAVEQEARNRVWRLMQEVNQVQLTVYFNGFKKDGTNAFNLSSHINVAFEDLRFSIQPMGHEEASGTFLYGDVLSDLKRTEFVTYCKKDLLGRIDRLLSSENASQVD